MENAFDVHLILDCVWNVKIKLRTNWNENFFDKGTSIPIPGTPKIPVAPFSFI